MTTSEDCDALISQTLTAAEAEWMRLVVEWSEGLPLLLRDRAKFWQWLSDFDNRQVSAAVESLQSKAPRRR